jgi:hypothetical protein
MTPVRAFRQHPILFAAAIVGGFLGARLAFALGWGLEGVYLVGLGLVLALVGAFVIADSRHSATSPRQR